MKRVVPLLLVAVLLVTIALPAMAAPPGDTIVDVALAINAETGEFSILIQALLAADPAVLETLGGNGQFTVFAPTDAAFVSLLDELGISAEDLLGDQALVTQVLLYHVAHGRRYSGSVLGAHRIRTLQRGFLFQDGGVLTDNNDRSSNIVVVDVEAANGVIHVIDRVVLP
jgi:transforming growth factor-beta-induced protein